MPRRLPTLEVVLRNIHDPGRWADIKSLAEVLREIPRVRGIVYGNVAEVKFVDWLLDNGVPIEDMARDPDEKKTKSDRTIVYRGRKYTVQLKSMQTSSIRELEDGTFTASVQVDASDKRSVVLPNGSTVTTTCYVAGEFDVLAVPMHPFTASWSFAFRLNSTLPRTDRYAPEDNEFLLKTLVRLAYPLEMSDDWTDDLFGLIEATPDLGEVIQSDEDKKVVRPPGSKGVAIVEGDES